MRNINSHSIIALINLFLGKIKQNKGFFCFFLLFAAMIVAVVGSYYICRSSNANQKYSVYHLLASPPRLWQVSASNTNATLKSLTIHDKQGALFFFDVDNSVYEWRCVLNVKNALEYKNASVNAVFVDVSTGKEVGRIAGSFGAAHDDSKRLYEFAIDGRTIGYFDRQSAKDSRIRNGQSLAVLVTCTNVSDDVGLVVSPVLWSSK